MLVALSGGSDSVALAYLLAELAQRDELRVAGVVHLNHQLRPAADDEEAFCGELAARLGWPFRAGRADVAARARAERRSVEDAARAARYEFFEEARLRLEADAIALGHTRDDQAETFLLRLMRGAGSRGLAGMHPRRGRIVRPLLDCRRARPAVVPRGARRCRSSTTSRTTTSASRAIASARSCCRCSSADSTRRSSTSWPTRPSWLARSGTGFSRRPRDAAAAVVSRPDGGRLAPRRAGARAAAGCPAARSRDASCGPQADGGRLVPARGGSLEHVERSRLRLCAATAEGPSTVPASAWNVAAATSS